jgi:hypothetical protein
LGPVSNNFDRTKGLYKKKPFWYINLFF